VLLVETSTKDAAHASQRRLDITRLQDLGAAVRDDGAVYSLEICRTSV
jgi:hypothetical protein